MVKVRSIAVVNRARQLDRNKLLHRNPKHPSWQLLNGIISFLHFRTGSPSRWFGHNRGATSAKPTLTLLDKIVTSVERKYNFLSY